VNIGGPEQTMQTTATRIQIRNAFIVVLLGCVIFGAHALSSQVPERRSEKSTPESLAVRSLSTNQVPLEVRRVSLSDAGQFAASGVIGGALAKVGSSLLLMNGSGELFSFKDDHLRRLDYGPFPNGREALKQTPLAATPHALNAIKALYVAFDDSRNRLYVSMQKFDAASHAPRFNVSVISIDKETLKNTSGWQTVFESEDIPVNFTILANHPQANGGRMVVAGNSLYFTIGDFSGGSPQRESDLRAQLSTSSFGKIYEHDLTTNKTRVKSIGHRNPAGLVFTKDGQLIDAEHGPEGGDELNVITDGGNYGWPYATYGTDYGSYNWPTPSAPTLAFAKPLYAWVPSPAISSVIEVSTFHQRWNGDLLVGSLKGQTLFRVKRMGDRVIFCEAIWVGHRVRDIVEMDNRLVLMTDDPALLFINVNEQRLLANAKSQHPAGAETALARCLYCHHFGTTNPTHVAPTLSKLMGRQIASDNFGGYSAALTKRPGPWDEASLAQFLADPNAFAPGSAMPNLGLSEREIRLAVSFLSRNSTETSAAR